MDRIQLLKNLERPTGPVSVVLDTDTYNEIDDQFALALMLLLPDVFTIEAITAAPFLNEKVSTAGEGMEESYKEIFNVLALTQMKGRYRSKVFRGSEHFLSDEQTAVPSAAVEELARLAGLHSPADPLYIIGIGAATNLASFLITYPELGERVVIIWLGGHAYWCNDNFEFNLRQDIASARVLFKADIPIIHVPCKGVSSGFLTTAAELTHWIGGKNPLCDYLVRVVKAQGEADSRERCWSRSLWDVVAVAWLLPGGPYVEDRLHPRPVFQWDHRYSFDYDGPPVKSVMWVYRDRLFSLLMETLAR